MPVLRAIVFILFCTSTKWQSRVLFWLHPSVWSCVCLRPSKLKSCWSEI